MFATPAQLLLVCAALLPAACSHGAAPPALAGPAAAVLFEAPPDPAQDDAALSAARRLDAEARAGGGLPRLTPQEHMRRAATYHANRAFAEAREHWQALIARYPRDTNVPAALFGLGRTFYQERRYADALPFFERLGAEFAGQKEGREGFYYVAATLLRLGRPADAAARYGEYAARFPQGERVENAYLNAIDSWREAGRDVEALDWIARTRQRFRGTAADTNALFAQLRHYVAEGDWPSAIQSADELLLAKLGAGVQTSTPEVAYLRAYSLERAKQTAQARAAYQAIPDKASSYYGGLATARLRELGEEGRRAASARESAVRREVVAAANSYPAPFREAVLKAVAGRKLDPRFVLAIMRQESGFNPRARSQAAARGLLQLTMDVVTKYGARAGQQAAREDDLYRPEVNLPIASEYLADLFRMFPRLPEAVAASYNGGEDNVARWVARAKQKDPGVVAAEVGFAESKDYVFKVMANYRVYRQLYTPDLRRQ